PTRRGLSFFGGRRGARNPGAGGVGRSEKSPDPTPGRDRVLCQMQTVDAAREPPQPPAPPGETVMTRRVAFSPHTCGPTNRGRRTPDPGRETMRKLTRLVVEFVRKED